MLIRIVLVIASLFLVSSCIVPPPTQSQNYGNSYGKQCGAVVTTCGCHGYVNLGAVSYTSECGSGYHEAVPCYNMGYCYDGGLPWGTRCAC